jgi:hypothetical protein
MVDRESAQEEDTVSDFSPFSPRRRISERIAARTRTIIASPHLISLDRPPLSPAIDISNRKVLGRSLVPDLQPSKPTKLPFA